MPVSFSVLHMLGCCLRLVDLITCLDGIPIQPQCYEQLIETVLFMRTTVPF